MIEIFADTKSTQLITSYLKNQDLDDLCRITEHQDEQIKITLQKEQKTFPNPVRLGHVLDQILIYNERALQNTTDNDIIFAGAVLDITHGLFTTKDQEPIQLTEKEVDILVFLNAQKGQTISKKDLLTAIWNYADGVETHTLETHIYRLRQKIEQDPANPEILKTDGDGYYIP